MPTKTDKDLTMPPAHDHAPQEGQEHTETRFVLARRDEHSERLSLVDHFATPGEADAAAQGKENHLAVKARIRFARNGNIRQWDMVA